MTSSIKPRHQGLWFALFLIAGCGSNGPTSPTNESISLRSIVPAEGTTLQAGQRITFTAVVSCTIANPNGGTATMFLLDQGNLTLLADGEMPPQAALVHGTTTVTLSHTITIPARGGTVSVRIFTNESPTSRDILIRDYTVR